MLWERKWTKELQVTLACPLTPLMTFSSPVLFCSYKITLVSPSELFKIKYDCISPVRALHGDKTRYSPTLVCIAPGMTLTCIIGYNGAALDYTSKRTMMTIFDQSLEVLHFTNPFHSDAEPGRKSGECLKVCVHSKEAVHEMIKY